MRHDALFLQKAASSPRPLLFLIAASLGIDASAATLPVQLSSGDSSIGPARFNQGWWSDTIPQTVELGVSGNNYLTGHFTIGRSQVVYRGFFSFSLAAVEQRVRSARLLIRHGTSVISPDATETVGVFDVITPARELNAKGKVDLSIFHDLGTGILFGSAVINVRDTLPESLTFDLNAEGINAINLARGDYFSVGLSLLTSDHARMTAEYLFAFTGDDPAVLELTVVPEPSAFAVAASSLLGLSLIRRRFAA